MSLSTFVLTASEAASAEPAINPWAVGGIVLGMLLVLLIVLIMFGAGREHS